MSAKAQVYTLSIILTFLGIGLIFYKTFSLDIPLLPDKERDVWVVEAVIDFKCNGDAAKVTFAIPPNTGSMDILNQHGSSNDFGFSLDEKNDRQRATWTKRDAKGNERIYYQFSFFDTLKTKPMKFSSKSTEKPFFKEPYKTAITDLVAKAWSKSADPETYARELFKFITKSKNSQNINLLKTFLNEKYTMNHLIRDMLRLKDIQSVVVKGLKLEDRVRNVEAQDFLAVKNKVWSIIDLASGEMNIPQNVIFWDTASILKYSGVTDAKMNFSIMKSRESARGLAIQKNLEKSPIMSFSIYTLPIQYQTIFQMLLLIPMGTFVVVIMRNIIGLSTSGTFMPVLLALAFIETTLVRGLIVLTVVLMLGLLVRFYLSRLNLLLVPRISAIVICVVILMAFISILSYKLGIEDGVSVTLFPMIIISWTIERTSVIWEEQGGREVFKQIGGSLLVSIMAYFIMTNSLVKYFTFTFPESLLILLALVMLLGTYTGYRVTELFRFEPLVKDKA